MKRSLLFCPLIAIFFFSCRSGNSAEGILSVNVPRFGIDNWQGSGLPKDSIGQPEHILALEDFIILSENSTQFALTVFNLSDSSIHRLLRYGNGPGEALQVNQLDTYPDRDGLSFYVHDDVKNKIFIFTLHGDEFQPAGEIDIEPYSFIAFDGDVMFACPVSGESRYVLKEQVTGTETRFGDYSEYGEQGTVPQNSLAAGFARTQAERKTFAWFSFYGESWDFFRYTDNGDVTPVKKQIYTPSVYNAQNRETVFSLETTFGFLSVASNDRNIYALYNGNTLEDFIQLRQDAMLCDYICVFDWDGNYNRLFVSDRKIKCISYNEKTGNLVAVVMDEELEYSVMYFNP